MLSPVAASAQAPNVSAAGVGQREARSEGPMASGASAQATPAPATALPSQGAAAETLQSLRQLAEMLGSQTVDAKDILTRLAIDFAAALSETPLPDETPRDFAARLANLIQKLPEPARAAAVRSANLAALGISLEAFTAALADPASPAAARIVALAEDPGAHGLQQKLQAAIESYEQNSAERPATLLAQKTAISQKAGDITAAARTPADATATAETPAGQQPADTRARAVAEEAVAPAPQGSARQAAADTLLRVAPLLGKAAGPLAESDASPPRAATPASAPLAEKPQPDARSAAPNTAVRADGQPTMQVLRGFNVVISNVATRAADVLKTVSTLAQQADARETLNPAGVTTPEAAEKSRVAPPPASTVAGEAARQVEPAIAGKAHEAAKAMEGRVIPLFSGASGGEDAETVDVARLIKVAEQAVARAETARVPDAALAQPRLPDGIPFAQVPYPFVKEEKEKGLSRRPDEEGAGDEDQQMAGEGGEQLWHGDGEQAERREEPEIEERPFDAEEPLKRNPTDAERALHMYQRFGGF